MNYTIDTFFLVDIFVNFNTAFYEQEYELVTSRKEIALNYLKSWFLLDFVSIIPTELFMGSPPSEAQQ